MLKNKKTLNFTKRKLYITSGQYENIKFEKKVKKDIECESITIKLDKNEKKLFNLLFEYVSSNNLNTIVRVAGGWVRDKILDYMHSVGLESPQNITDNGCEYEFAFKKDIDIALDNLSGKEFAEGFNNWLQQVHNYPKHTVGIINRDPEKSKHLETATLIWNEICIDFVGLRSETYTLDSRIPTINLGTAEEDAYRRDFTINSMFYNINDGKIEDFTNMGLVDLHNKIIRTPLDPIKTLLDDPLRALRAFRFTSRLHFIMEDNLLNACKENSLRDSLRTKISRERIGSEIHEMISNKYSGNPAIGLKLIVNSGLVYSVFKFPDNETIFSYLNNEIEFVDLSQLGDWYSIGPFVVELTHRTIELLVVSENNESVFCGVNFINLLSFDQESNWGTSTYFAFMLPLFHYYYKNEKGKEILLIKYILSNSLKLSNKISNSVVSLVSSCLTLIPSIIELDSLNLLANYTIKDNDFCKVDLYCNSTKTRLLNQVESGLLDFYTKHFKFIQKSCDLKKNTERKIKLGLFISITGELWIELIVSLFSLDIIYRGSKFGSSEKNDRWSDSELKELFHSHPCFNLIKEIASLKLDKAYEFKNPVDGKMISRHFPKLSKGPKYKYLINMSHLWFIAFSNDISCINEDEISRCICFIENNCEQILNSEDIC
ncbi:Cca1p [Cryptosporidium bovis]|uniref:Cca1p n=1 Tax=Cryptosporidium bovis TaxID=310047 RepID=UPI00351A90CD|nr:Cca1p [Cryptosporidium bovis]